MRLNKDISLTVILLIGIVILSFVNIEEARPKIESSENIRYDESTNTLYLDSLTIKQKIAQMVVTSGVKENKEELHELFIGGVYFGAEPAKSDYIYVINFFQDGAIVPLFIATDMEGFRNPFENFQKFPVFTEIQTKEQAYDIGYEQGKLLKELGFNLNFAPVVDLEDNIWNCRNLPGTPEEIAEKADYYIDGLQENQIIATSKHYPGKTLSSRDPHKFIVNAVVDKNDLFPFEQNIENKVSAVMVSHIIIKGHVDSGSKPSVVSEKIISGLRNKFTGLIVTDAISLLGLKNFYADEQRMYIDLFKAGNDIVLNFDYNIENVQHMIDIVANAVERGEISEEKIDDSVTRILNAKGINVK